MTPPEILTPGKLDEINNYVLAKTGCFAFLVPNDGWHYSEPKTGKGAVELWAVALYAIYHDYGCRYLKFILNINNKPNSALTNQLVRSYKHMNNIQSVIRTNVAHGTLDEYSIQRFRNVYFNSVDSIDSITEEQWNLLAEKIKKESDELVEVLYKWADGYCDSNSNIRTIFGRSDDFKRSIDKRLMFDTLDNDFCTSRRSLRAKKILEDNPHDSPDSAINRWKEDISNLFLRNEIHSPQDVLSQLRMYLYEIHNPISSSSASVGQRFGFSLSSLE